MHKFTVIAGALAVAATWTFAPAYAQTTTEKMERKAERAADKVEDKAESAKDTIKDKAENAKDTVKDKAVSAKDTIKDKTARATNKMRDKMHRAEDRMAMSDTRAAQGALKTQGFDPGPIDGRMGPRTEGALRDYQRKNELPVTGMLDTATMSKLNVRTSERSSDAPAASPGTPPKQSP